MRQANDLLKMIRGDTSGKNPGDLSQFKLATIDPNYVSGAPYVTFDGESKISGRKYPYVGTYKPTPNDRVLMAKMGHTWVVVGNIDGVNVGGGTNGSAISRYVEVVRFPLYGIAGQSMFSTTSATWVSANPQLIYGPLAYSMPAPAANAQRYYKLMIIGSNNITSSDTVAAHVQLIGSDGSVMSGDFTMPYVWGGISGERCMWLSNYWQSTNGNHANLQFKVCDAGGANGAGKTVTCSYAELIAYDYYQ